MSSYRLSLFTCTVSALVADISSLPFSIAARVAASSAWAMGWDRGRGAGVKEVKRKGNEHTRTHPSAVCGSRALFLPQCVVHGRCSEGLYIPTNVGINVGYDY